MKIVDAFTRFINRHERQHVVVRKPYDDGLVELARLIDADDAEKSVEHPANNSHMNKKKAGGVMHSPA